MQNSSLATFIAHARSKGMDHQTIRMLLLSAGWKDRDVSEALASETLDIPVPLPTDAGSARDAFFHLLSFTTLISTVTSVIVLFYTYWDRLFPDAAFPSYDTGVSSTIRWAIAVALVSFPLYLWMMRILHREMSQHHEKLASGVRRWLTYLILFVTACTLVGDLITVLSSLLNGELTVRFILKAATIFVLCGLPFLYYFRTMRLDADQYAKSPVHKIYLAVSVILVGVAVVWGFVIAGSPSYGRSEQLDQVRENDLRTIQSEILNITLGTTRPPLPAGTPPTLKNPLPKTLQDVASNAVYQQPTVVDPETGEPYGYKVTSAHTFDLCAVFALERAQQYDIFWNHPAGEHCYSFDVLEGQTK